MEDENRECTDTWHSFCPGQETSGLRQDSGLQYVGNVQELQQSSGFKPMYPYQYNRELSSLSMRPHWRTHSITGFPEEQPFLQNVEAQVYDNWYTGRLFSGVNKLSDSCGVLTPLTPTIERDCILLACWHTTQAEKIDKNTLSMVTAVAAPWSLFNNIQQRVTLKLLAYAKRPPAFSKPSAQCLIAASMEDLEGCIVPIMLTLLCSNPTTGAGPPPQLQGFTNFFVPACDDLQPGDAAIVIVHGGCPSVELASKFLKTTVDRDQLDTTDDHWTLYDLDQEEPAKCLHSLDQEAIFPS